MSDRRCCVVSCRFSTQPKVEGVRLFGVLRNTTIKFKKITDKSNKWNESVCNPFKTFYLTRAGRQLELRSTTEYYLPPQIMTMVQSKSTGKLKKIKDKGKQSY
ncbi:uncharacterized protein LOC117642066 [Thrips palmi]|uniref:Uncharacterized protein LOC117642066 n=1 Tax=Thrips palmi TaxID=161013 RepID=A0A6P8YFT5_THRPL|nr:uncharacterized protein LOC117642066 [Thrips palmi]